MIEVALLLFGILIGLLPPWFARKRRLKTHWCALRAEMDECSDKAGILLRDNIQSPLYRLPVNAFTISFPIVLADGAVGVECPLLVVAAVAVPDGRLGPVGRAGPGLLRTSCLPGAG
jgi:hypothetical protein